MKKYITLAALLAAGTAFANAALTTVDVSDDTFTINGAKATLLLDGLKFEITNGNENSLRTDVNSTNGQFSATNIVFDVDAAKWGESYVSDYIAASAKGVDLTITISGYEANQEGISLSFVAGVPFEGQGSWASFATLSNEFTEGTAYSAGSGATTVTTTTLPGSDPLSPFSPVVYVYEGVKASDTGTISFVIDGVDYHSAGICAIRATSVPEPSAFGLLAGLGALALVGTRRRRK